MGSGSDILVYDRTPLGCHRATAQGSDGAILEEPQLRRLVDWAVDLQARAMGPMTGTTIWRWTTMTATWTGSPRCSRHARTDRYTQLKSWTRLSMGCRPLQGLYTRWRRYATSPSRLAEHMTA